MRISDWSSDVCSSDLPVAIDGGRGVGEVEIAASERVYENIAGGQRAARVADGDAGVAAAAIAADAVCSGIGDAIGFDHDHRRRDAAAGDRQAGRPALAVRSEEHTSELQSLMRISYAVF